MITSAQPQRQAPPRALRDLLQGEGGRLQVPPLLPTSSTIRFALVSCRVCVCVFLTNNQMTRAPSTGASTTRTRGSRSRPTARGRRARTTPTRSKPSSSTFSALSFCFFIIFQAVSWLLCTQFTSEQVRPCTWPFFIICSLFLHLQSTNLHLVLGAISPPFRQFFCRVSCRGL